MQKEDSLYQNKLKSLYFAKRISEALIILSAAVILIISFMYVHIFYFPNPFINKLARFDDDYIKSLEYYNSVIYLFLHSFIIPGASCIVILIPIRIIIGRRFKIYTIALIDKYPSNLKVLYKFKNNRNLRDFREFQYLF